VDIPIVGRASACGMRAVAWVWWIAVLTFWLGCMCTGVKSSVTIPRPIPGLVSSTVLVESFEKGQGVAVFMREPHAINTQIVALGVDAYLKMLLSDNFVHTDLHPGVCAEANLWAHVVDEMSLASCQSVSQSVTRQMSALLTA